MLVVALAATTLLIWLILCHAVLVAEAGTGTGKTLAYLVPAALSGRKVVISTATKTLQDQLFHKDLPLVQEGLGLDVRATLVKGRANYLCLQRLGRVTTETPNPQPRLSQKPGKKLDAAFCPGVR